MTDEAIEAIAKRLTKQNEKYSAIKAERAALRQMLMEALDERERDTILTGKYTIERVSHVQWRFDAKRFAEFDPQTYEAFTRPIKTTRLQISG